MAYFVVFSISTLLAFVSESFFKQRTLRDGRQSPAWLVFAVAAVLVVSVLNWIRDYSIGTDVLYYGNRTFIASCMTDSFANYYYYCDTVIGMHEPGYALLNWIISRCTHSAHFFYLFLGLITNSPAYATACRFRSYSGSVAISWLTYLLLAYPASLNMLRQGLAIVMVAFAFSGLPKAGWKRYLVWVLLSCSIHQSAIVAAALLPLYLLLERYLVDAKKGASSKQTLLLVVAFVSCVAAASSTLGILGGTSVLPDKYTQYLEVSNVGRDLTNAVLIRSPFVLLALWLVFVRRGSMGVMELCLTTFILSEFALLPLQNISDAAFRISLYFGVFKMVAYPAILRRLIIPRWVTVPAYLAYIFFIFIYQVIYSGGGEVYPFLVASDIF